MSEGTGCRAADAGRLRIVVRDRPLVMNGLRGAALTPMVLVSSPFLQNR